MKKMKLFALLLLTAGAMLSCEDNDDNNSGGGGPSSEFTENFGNTATRDFIGQVVNESNDPISNATVKIGSTTVQTDANGIFIANDAQVYEKFAYITVTKAGYLDGSRSLVPTTGKNNVKIMMLAATVVGTVNSGAADDVTLPNGTKVTFDGNFKTEAGTAYSGTVSVMMHHLDPADPNMAAKMPGMLYAENEDGEERILESYGMINVELRGSGGQKLQLSGSAEIEAPISPAQLASAPSSIPLWHFDEAGGYWKQEGSATRVGNKYVGEVTHFSWWNCDAQFPTVTLTATVVDGDGNPIPNVLVLLIREGEAYGAGAYSDSEGHMSGLVPAGETLTMKIYSYGACGTGGLISTSTIGPFSADTTLPNIVITPTATVQPVTVEGTLVNCDGDDVTNGYVLMTYGSGNVAYLPVTDGSFTYSVIVCDAVAGFTLEGVDYDSHDRTGEINYMFTTPVTHVGTLQTCDDITEFINYQVNAEPMHYLIGTTSGHLSYDPGPYLSVSAYNPTQEGLYIWGQVDTPGTYTTADGFSIEGGGFYISNGTPNTVSFVVSNIGAVGEYIDISFSGTFTNDDGTHTISGVAHVIRD